MAKMAALAPMQMASVSTAVGVKPRSLISTRSGILHILKQIGPWVTSIC